MVQFSGHFDGNVITPDGRVSIPVNTPLRITIEVEAPNESQSVDWNRLLDIAKECAIEGPEDLADRHDCYAHGKPVQ